MKERGTRFFDNASACQQSTDDIVYEHISFTPDMANIVALLLINMFIFAIIGLSIFGDSCPRHFGTLGSSETNYQGHPLTY